jgi:hypothetical protein
MTNISNKASSFQQENPAHLENWYYGPHNMLKTFSKG